jgi:hypothetical protein
LVLLALVALVTLVLLVLQFLLLSLLLFPFLTPTLLLLVSLSHRRDYKISKTMHDQVMHGHRMLPQSLALLAAGCCWLLLLQTAWYLILLLNAVYTAFGRHSLPVPHTGPYPT